MPSVFDKQESANVTKPICLLHARLLHARLEGRVELV
jgi:NAD(P)-dependent dehydrogenase (short-subunit alcohol dehydrogenase family)